MEMYLQEDAMVKKWKNEVIISSSTACSMAGRLQAGVRLEPFTVLTGGISSISQHQHFAP
jgi:hypothetical protein